MDEEVNEEIEIEEPAIGGENPDEELVQSQDKVINDYMKAVGKLQ